MAKIPDIQYDDFSGGINRAKSPYLLKDNELQRGRNFEVEEKGRIKKRKGSIQFGQNISSIGRFHHDNLGLYAAAFTSPTVVYKSLSAVNNTALTTASTTIPFDLDGVFTASGTVEINGDRIAYTGGGAASGTLTGVTGIAADIDAWQPMNQWQSIGTMTGHVGTGGVWFSYLADRTCILSEDGAASPSADLSTYDGSTVAAVASMDVSAKFLETFRDRLFTVGSNSSTVYFSDLGVTTFPTAIADNSFEIEDGTGEHLSSGGIKVYRENLLLFKNSATYAYSGSLPVRQLSQYFGIHNDACIQEINGLLYGFGASGVWVSNGASFIKIDQPVEEYIKDILWNIQSSSVPVSRIKTAQWKNKFMIYINELREPGTSASITQLTLVYDTKEESWEVIDGFTAVTAFNYLNNFKGGGNVLLQDRPILLYSDGSSVFRAFENRTMTRLQTGLTGNSKGGDLYSNEFFEDSGSDIVFEVLTKPYDLKLPQYKKSFGYLKVFSERPNGTHISVIIDNGDPIPLGQIKETIQRFQFPANTKGHRCAILLEESSQVQSLIINGFVFEDCATISK